MATLRNLAAGILNLPGRPASRPRARSTPVTTARILPSRTLPPALARHDQ
jgi:hypothetical protein